MTSAGNRKQIIRVWLRLRKTSNIFATTLSGPDLCLSLSLSMRRCQNFLHVPGARALTAGGSVMYYAAGGNHSRSQLLLGHRAQIHRSNNGTLIAAPHVASSIAVHATTSSPNAAIAPPPAAAVTTAANAAPVSAAASGVAESMSATPQSAASGAAASAPLATQSPPSPAPTAPSIRVASAQATATATTTTTTPAAAKRSPSPTRSGAGAVAVAAASRAQLLLPAAAPQRRRPSPRHSALAASAAAVAPSSTRARAVPATGGAGGGGGSGGSAGGARKRTTMSTALAQRREHARRLIETASELFSSLSLASKAFEQMQPDARRHMVVAAASEEWFGKLNVKTKLREADAGDDTRICAHDYNVWMAQSMRQRMERIPRGHFWTLVAFFAAPFFAMGFLDNCVFIVAGDVFDSLLWTHFGLTGMYCAGLAGVVSGTFGLQVHGVARRVIMATVQMPETTSAQRNSKWYSMAKRLGGVMGLCSGLAFGMAPLLWLHRSGDDGAAGASGGGPGATAPAPPVPAPTAPVR